MAAPTANECFWAFVTYVKGNPYKTFGCMTSDDFDNMAKLFAATNSDAITDATNPLDTYTDVEWPDYNGGAGTVAATGTNTVNAWYPETHQGG